jgi:hypothetical protein
MSFPQALPLSIDTPSFRFLQCKASLHLFHGMSRRFLNRARFESFSQGLPTVGLVTT